MFRNRANKCGIIICLCDQRTGDVNKRKFSVFHIGIRAKEREAQLGKEFGCVARLQISKCREIIECGQRPRRIVHQVGKLSATTYSDNLSYALETRFNLPVAAPNKFKDTAAKYQWR